MNAFLPVAFGAVTYLGYVNFRGRDECGANISKLKYLQEHGPEMNPPATLDEMRDLEMEIAKQEAYMAKRVAFWFPPTPDWTWLPMDKSFH
jgi:hypothetical protein